MCQSYITDCITGLALRMPAKHVASFLRLFPKNLYVLFRIKKCCPNETFAVNFKFSCFILRFHTVYFTLHSNNILFLTSHHNTAKNTETEFITQEKRISFSTSFLSLRCYYSNWDLFWIGGRSWIDGGRFWIDGRSRVGRRWSWVRGVTAGATGLTGTTIGDIGGTTIIGTMGW